MAAHLAIYPLGLVQERTGRGRRTSLAGLAPVQRALHVHAVEAASTPILLVHGMVDNRSIFTLLRRGLRRAGFADVTSFGYSPLTVDVRRAATRLAERVEDLCARSGADRIHLVGHSLGGIVARYYVQCLGGDRRVHTLVTIGTPHEGTETASAAPHAYLLARQVRPGSELLAELAAPAPGCRTRVVAFWSDLDQVVVPRVNARIAHPDLDVRNVLIRCAGHMSLPIHPRLVREVCAALADLPPTTVERRAAG